MSDMSGYYNTPQYAQQVYGGPAQPMVDMSSLGMQIDPATGLPVTAAPSAGLLTPQNLMLGAGAAYLGKRKLAKRAATRLATEGATNAERAAIDNLSSQGAASRAGFLKSAITGRAPASAAQSAAQIAPEVAAPATIPQMVGGIGQMAAPTAQAIPRIASPETASAFLKLGEIPQMGPASQFTSRAASVPWAPAAVDAAEGAAGAGLAGAAEGTGARAALMQFAPGLSSGARMGAAGIGATIAGNVADRLDIGGHNSALDQAATGGAAGATGGAIVAGPLGALVGGAAGAAGNVGYNAIADKLWRKGGGDKVKPVDTLAQNRAALAQAGSIYSLSDSERKLLTANHDAAVLAAGSDKKKQAEYSTQAMQQLLSQLPQYVQQQGQYNQQTRNDSAFQSAAQQWADPYLAMQRATYETQAQQYEAMAKAAKTPSEAQMYGFQAANARAAGAQGGAAFAQQVALAPGNQALARQQAQEDAIQKQLAAQLAAKAVNSYVNPSAASSATLASTVQ